MTKRGHVSSRLRHLKTPLVCLLSLVSAAACVRSGFPAPPLDERDAAVAAAVDAAMADATSNDGATSDVAAPDARTPDAHDDDSALGDAGESCVSQLPAGGCLPQPECVDALTCGDVALLMHFDNLSAYGEDDHNVHDFSGGSNHATCTDPLCPTWRAGGGRFGGGFEFLAGPRLEIPDADGLDFADAVTVAAWFFPRELQDNWRPVVSKVESATERSNFWIGHSGTAMCITFNDGTWHNRCAGDYATGTWYHLAGVFDDTNDRVALYVNGLGVIDETETTELPVETGSVWIGWAPLDDAVNGVIDEVIIFNRALDQAEIDALRW